MFAYVTPTVSVTLPDSPDAPGEPRPNPTSQRSHPPALPPSLLRLPPGLFVWFLLPPGAEDESEERTQTSCLLDLEDGDKCGFRLFQGTHISHAWEGALGLLGGKAAAVLAIAMVRRGRRGGGRGREGGQGGIVIICLPGAHSLHSLRKL